jgi:hypothetical protein
MFLESKRCHTVVAGLHYIDCGSRIGKKHRRSILFSMVLLTISFPLTLSLTDNEREKDEDDCILPRRTSLVVQYRVCIHWRRTFLQAVVV